MADRIIPCSACSGTGWTPYQQRCGACGGQRVVRATDAPTDADRWAWNHFDEPDDDHDDTSTVSMARGCNPEKAGPSAGATPNAPVSPAAGNLGCVAHGLPHPCETCAEQWAAEQDRAAGLVNPSGVRVEGGTSNG